MTEQARATPIRVLLIDDDEEDCLLIRDLLARAPVTRYRVEWAPDYEQGLARLREDSCHVCLLDYRLGARTGIDLLSAARACGVSVPIVMMTGAGGDEVDTAAMLAGASDYVDKAEVSTPALTRVIRHAIERAEAERRLRTNEERFRALVEHSADVICLNAADGTMIYCNDAITQMAGYSIEEYVGRNAFDFVHPDDIPAVTRSFETVLHSPGQVVRAEMRMRHKNGQWIDIEATGVNRLADPAVHAIVVNMRDLSARKRAEQQLKRAEAHLAGAARVAVLGSWEVELDGTRGSAYRRVWWSAETYRIYGYEPGAVQPSVDFFREVAHPEDRTFVVAHASRCIQTGDPFVVEHRIVRRDGSERVVRQQASLDRDAAGRPVRMIGTVLDITEQKALEQQFLQAQKMEAVGRLAGGLAHDFNNILTAIIGTCDLVEGELPANAPIEADIHEIRLAAERAARLTQQLLAFSRQQVMTRKAINLNHILEDLTSMLRRLIGEDITLKTRFADGLGSVRADLVHIEQVVANLVVNARDAMPNGGMIEIATSNVDADDAFVATRFPMQPGPYVQLEIRDTGTGMTPETKAKAFEPFFTTKERGKGTGLGLSTVYGIVKQSGGFVFVESQVGEGTSVQIYFPREAEAEAVRPAGRAAESGEAPRGGAETVLVVEDEAAVRVLVRRALERRGYTVLEASNPKEAFAIADRHPGPIHVLLTDMVMPGGGGLEVVQRVRVLRPGIRAILMSGYAPNLAQAKDSVVALTYLAKPFGLDDVTGIVRRVLDADEEGVADAGAGTAGSDPDHRSRSTDPRGPAGTARE